MSSSSVSPTYYAILVELITVPRSEEFDKFKNSFGVRDWEPVRHYYQSQGQVEPLAHRLPSISITTVTGELRNQTGLNCTTLDLGQGDVRLYKISLPSESSTIDTSSICGSGALAVLAVPSHMSSTAFLAFLGDEVRHISFLQKIRTDTNRYMIILKLKKSSLEDACNLQRRLKEACFDSLESVHCVQICSVSFVQRQIQVRQIDAIDNALNKDHKSVCETPGDARHNTVTCTELPSCIVCLERLEVSATGLSTVSQSCCEGLLCSCTSRWLHKKTSCAVCRKCLAKTSLDDTETPCVCGSTRNLWQCLVCGR